MRLRTPCVLIAIAWTWFGPCSARADDARDPGAAETLFEAAKALMKSGDAEAACPKFEQSQALDPGAGTQFFLADCYETTGRVARAYALFHDLEGVLVRVNDPRAKLAGERARNVEPRVPRLTVRIPWAKNATRLVVLQDERPVDNDQMDHPAYLEVGAHRVEVRAAGRRAWQTAVALREGQSMTLDVPELALEAPALADEPRSPRRTIGIVTAIAGAAVLVGGVVVVGVAKANYDSAVTGCTKDGGTYQCADPHNQSSAERATSLANAGTVIGAIGVAAVAAGIVVWITSPKGHASRRSFLAPSPGGAVVGGSF